MAEAVTLFAWPKIVTRASDRSKPTPAPKVASLGKRQEKGKKQAESSRKKPKRK